MSTVQRNKQPGKFMQRVAAFGVLALGLGLGSARAAEVPSDWSVGLNFSFSNASAPGGVSQDPLALTLGTSQTQQVTKLKPPLPPGMAKTNNAGYPLIDAFVKNNDGQRVFNDITGADAGGRASFVVEVTAEQAQADVSITLDCTGLPSGMTLNLVHARTQKRKKVTAADCAAGTYQLNNFLQVAQANTPEEVFVLGAPDGGGFVGATKDGKVIGAVTTDHVTGAVNGVKVTIGGQTANITEDGVFVLDGVNGVQEVVVSRKGHLKRKVNVDLNNGDPIALPKLAGGDANNDNKIDLKDLGVLKQQYNNQTPCYQEVEGNAECGDANGDGKVDLKDLGVVKQNYKQVGD